MIETPPLLLLTFEHFVQKSLQLAQKIEAEHKDDPYDYIISINRGGAVLSRILSDYLDIKIGAFSISSYASMTQQKVISISQTLNMYLSGKKILLVDEICDTGNTFQTAQEHVEKLLPRATKTATLFMKPHSFFVPDYVLEETNDWVVFPYEIRETIKSLQPFLEGNEALTQELQQYFIHVGADVTTVKMLMNRE